ncbi:hypothetical protein A3A79_00610 [Candidatus Gottesmanbacteria bacterium RIFCSPLOWO2_01_FULL_43_11b]|uniref:Uncharacterized protein n=1 Tax=Candidatus Gottesmanbacteria bacterium RIFCSPLOWO2_01_FULL_43_11b TaxID=1798392 RepID=A0A1F6AGG2_9BACT|nr:MAG: hypothetical protein A3A79_00610 [Candidatus Gottesmanbacteria bacterium RIFCSPLOWO2_01_FULL_43_11b]
MEKDNSRIEITPIHPFTRRQAELIVTAVNHRVSHRSLSQRFGISTGTVRTHVTEILGIIESITNHRPVHLKGAINVMMGDVLFLRKK